MSGASSVYLSSGSNAGRGFRYQDLNGALFCIRMITSDAGLEAIIPEGSDDYELRRSGGSIILIDTKATRPDARLRSQAEDSKSLKKLWSRPVRQGDVVSEYWIVSERGRDGVNDPRISAKDLFPGNPPVEANRSFLIIEADPMRAATALLIEHKELTPLAAELVVIALARESGDLASSNGSLPLGQRKSLTASDVERIVSRVVSAVDAARLEQLVRSGFLTPVDFATPIADAGFYLGVDVEPGHFVAGLALDRPEATARILEALDRTRAVVVTGPSGAGKSGLMWNTVITARQGRRWFRVNGAGAPDAEALTAFFEAYAKVPIGLVVDDIGRGRLEVWDALRPRIATQPEAVVIGSMRTEDVALLPGRHAIAEVTADADASLAKILWRRLRESDQTAWPGWSEPWAKSNGLLLEYGHILTQGERLGAVILDQIRRRLSERRDDELALLGASAPVAAYGGVVLIETLRTHLKLSNGDMARALERLIEEHLVRTDSSRTRLTGLHALRASSICAALAEVGYSTPLEQANAAISVVAPESIEACVGGLIATGAIDETTAGAALAARLTTTPILSEMASALRGLRGGALTRIAHEWTTDLQTWGVPPKLATLAGLLGVTQTEALPDIGNMRMLAERGRELFAVAAALQPTSELVEGLIAALASTAGTAPVDVVDALSVLANTSLTSAQRSTLASTRPRLEDYPMSDVISILDAAEAIDPALSAAWTAPRSGADGPDLLTRLVAETPYALAPVREEAVEGLIVHADVYEAALEPGENPNDRLFAYAKAILRVEPAVHLAHARLVNAAGARALHLDSEKRILRGSATPDALASSNRRLIDAVARAVGGESWSTYLSRGEELLVRGHDAFQRLMDNAMVGRVEQDALDTLNAGVEACDNLIAPADSHAALLDGAELSGRHLTPLQDLIFNLNGRLIIDVTKLPERANLLAARSRDMIARVDETRTEPWSLIRDTTPPVLEAVKETLNDIEVVALEAAASGQNPSQRWPKKNRKPKDAFAFVVRGSRHAFTQRVEARRHALEVLVARELPGVKLQAPSLEDGNIWPSRFIASFPVATLEGLKRWILEARAIGDRVSTQLGEREDIALVPTLNGKAAIDYAYQLSRGNPDSLVAKVLNLAEQTHLLAPPDEKLIRRLGVPIITHPPELERVFVAIRDVSGILQLGLHLNDSRLSERTRLENALSELKTDGPEVVALFDGIDHPAVRALQAIIDLFCGGDVSDVGVDSLFLMDGLHDALAELTWRRASAAP